MTDHAFVEHFQSLTGDGKLALLSRLWKEVAQKLEGQPLTEAERTFLDDRIRQIDADPRPDRDWEDVRDELLSDQ